jgi:RNA polymerase sigma-70 factor (ECF subfamily)
MIMVINSKYKAEMEKYYKELIGYFTYYIGNRQDAEDIVHESYEKVLRARKRGTILDEPRAFLYKTARNLIIDTHRKTKSHKLKSIDTMELEAPPSERPDNRYTSRVIDSALLEAIGTLSPRCKEAFLLNRMDGLTNKEVAKKMDISLNMVEKHIIKAMKVCRKVIQIHGEE